MKKFVIMLLALVLVFACTMTSFAAEEKTEEQKKVEEYQQKILDELKKYVSVDAEMEAAIKTLDYADLIEIRGQKEYLKALAAQTEKDVKEAAAKNDTAKIAELLNSAVAQVKGYGIEISELKAEDITINADGTISAKATISYMGGSAKVTLTNAKSTTNPLGQKTGDNGLVIVLAGLAVVSAVLVIGMRKSRAMAL